MLNFIFGIIVGSRVSFLIFSIFSANDIKQTDEQFDDLKEKGTQDEKY